MRITNINLKPYNKGNLKAYIDITFEGKLSIKQCKLLEGKKGFFIGYPANKNGEKYYPFIKVSDDAIDFKNYIIEEVIKEYNKLVEKIEEDYQEENVNEVI